MQKLTLFLDIDGVLLTEPYQLLISGLEKAYKTPSKDKYGYFFNPYSVHLLNELYKQIDYSIVITSQWRIDLGFEKLKSMWIYRNYPSQIAGVTENISPNQRSLEIENYILSNNIRNYVIVDDLKKDSFSKTLQKHFVECDTKKGLTLENYELILNLSF